MIPLTPSSEDIILALEALGFDVKLEDDDDKSALLSDGVYNLRIHYYPTSDQLHHIRTALEDVFTDYAKRVRELTDIDSWKYDITVSDIADWLGIRCRQKGGGQ